MGTQQPCGELDPSIGTGTQKLPFSQVPMMLQRTWPYSIVFLLPVSTSTPKVITYVIKKINNTKSSQLKELLRQFINKNLLE